MSHEVFQEYASQILASGRPVLVAHRGVTSGIIPPNTAKAVKAAVISGADVAEIDVARSLDGEYFTFHDTYEPRLITNAPRLTKLYADQIRRRRYWEHDEFDCGSIETFQETLSQTQGTYINVDRSYRYWKDGFLNELAEWADPSYMLMKCRFTDDEIRPFLECSVDYPFMIVCHTVDDIIAACALDDPRLVGLEVTTTPKDPHVFDPEVIQGIKKRGLLLWLNALNLENTQPLSNRMDDDRSLFSGEFFGQGWQQLRDTGADIIQTDWVWACRKYFESTHNAAAK